MFLTLVDTRLEETRQQDTKSRLKHDLDQGTTMDSNEQTRTAMETQETLAFQQGKFRTGLLTHKTRNNEEKIHKTRHDL